MSRELELVIDCVLYTIMLLGAILWSMKVECDVKKKRKNKKYKEEQIANETNC